MSVLIRLGHLLAHRVRRGGRRDRSIAVFLAAALFVPSYLPPAYSVTRTTVSIAVSNPLTTLNPYLADGGLFFDGQVSYLNMSNFFYVTDKNVVKANTELGSANLISKNPFTIEYQVNPGRLWSDGVEITAEDLLVGFITCSPTYAAQAKLGSSDTAKFKSSCYQSKFGALLDGMPILSSDKMKLTITLKSPYPNWRLDGLKIWPTHALMNFVDGRNTLPSLDVSKLARQRFVNAVYGYDSVFLSRVGDV